MSIDWLYELERAIENGQEIFATQSVGRSNWVIGKSIDELKKSAQRAANHKKLAVSIARLIPQDDTIAGDLFLVPINIGDPGTRGEPNIKWSAVDTKEAAEMMRDVRHGPSPCFGMQIEETLEPVIQDDK
jgi:hypothetical protein